MIAVRRTREGALTERVARLLLGAPSGIDSEKGQARFGDISVNLRSGKFFDFDDETSGTHIELIQRVKNLQNGQAEAWLKENITDARPMPLPAESATERALIGMLAARPELMAAIEEEVTADHFGEIVHKQFFEAIAQAHLFADGPVSMKELMEAAGGDPLCPAFEGITLAVYVARIIAEAPMPPDAAHFARTLAAKIRSDANREGDVEDEYDIEPEPAPFVSQFSGITFEQLDDPGPEYAYVIDDTITVGDKSIIGGPSRSGKSFLAIHMGMCIATARPFFDRKILTPGLVVYQAGEGGRGIKKRFRAWRQEFAKDIPKGQRVPIYILQSKVDIYSADGDTSKLIEELRGISRLYGMPLIAVFIDTLQKAQGHADENSGKDMGIVMANVDRIAAAIPGCHVCLIHHMNAGGTKLRGHTSVYAGIEQVILVSKDEKSKIRTALLDKVKDDEDGSQIMFELPSIEIGRRQVDGKPITSCVVVQSDGLAPRPEKKGPRLTHERTVILQALQTAIEEYGEPTPAVLHLPKSITRVVNAQQWKKVYLEKSPDPEAPDNTINKRLRYASEQFQNLGLIGRTNPWVWLSGKPANEDPHTGPQMEFPEDIP
jgi:hypothetical protein